MSVAGQFTRPVAEALPVEQVIVPTPASGTGPSIDSLAPAALAEPDDRYFETRPGQRQILVFRAESLSPPSADSTVTRLIEWQGWYREWFRPSWLAEPLRAEPFAPGDAAILTALHRWRDRQASFEREFYSSKVPVR